MSGKLTDIHNTQYSNTASLTEICMSQLSLYLRRRIRHLAPGKLLLVTSVFSVNICCAKVAHLSWLANNP